MKQIDDTRLDVVQPVKVRNVTFDSEHTNICIPIVGKTKEEIISQCREIVKCRPDVIEFRADWYAELESQEALNSLLVQIRNEAGEIPVLFTIRTHKEGGQYQNDWLHYMRCNRSAARSKMVDLIDVEAFYSLSANELDEMTAEQLAEYECYEVKEGIRALQQEGVKIITSNHDFSKTPEKLHMVSRLRSMQKQGADIAKLAVMPAKNEDVRALLEATGIMTKQYPDTPVITMSMGARGVVSRISGAVFGNAMTFACAKVASAPGQIPVEKLREILSFYK